MEFICGNKFTDTSSLGFYLEYHNHSSCSSGSSKSEEFGEDYALSVPCEYISDSCSINDSKCVEFGEGYALSVPCKENSSSAAINSQPAASNDTDPEDILKVGDACGHFYQLTLSDARNLGILFTYKFHETPPKTSPTTN
jgi:hypothetical protein